MSEITINTNSIKGEVKQTLSLVGKRAVDRQGNTLFAGITLSSAEDKILDTFINEGLDAFLGEVAQFVTTGRTPYILNVSRVNEEKVSAFEHNAVGFIKNFALQKAFEMSGQTEQAKNADANMQRHLDSAIKLVFCKDSPTTGTESFAISSSASVETTEKKDGYNQ